MVTQEAALTETDTAAALGNQVERQEEGPFFLDDAGPRVDIPTLITRANARELLGKRLGESVTEALARHTSRDG